MSPKVYSVVRKTGTSSVRAIKKEDRSWKKKVQKDEIMDLRKAESGLNEPVFPALQGWGWKTSTDHPEGDLASINKQTNKDNKNRREGTGEGAR